MARIKVGVVTMSSTAYFSTSSPMRFASLGEG